MTLHQPAVEVAIVAEDELGRMMLIRSHATGGAWDVPCAAVGRRSVDDAAIALAHDVFALHPVALVDPCVAIELGLDGMEPHRIVHLRVVRRADSWPWADGCGPMGVAEWCQPRVLANAMASETPPFTALAARVLRAMPPRTGGRRPPEPAAVGVWSAVAVMTAVFGAATLLGIGGLAALDPALCIPPFVSAVLAAVMAWSCAARPQWSRRPSSLAAFPPWEEPLDLEPGDRIDDAAADPEPPTAPVAPPAGVAPPSVPHGRIAVALAIAAVLLLRASRRPS